MTLNRVLSRLADGNALSREEARAAFAVMMEGHATDVEIAALLTALRVRGETVDELFGAATALRDRVGPIHCPREGVLDTCGTGGDHAGTFNISTATAIVAAACGVPVAKHGNRAVSSTSGSADVLRALGVCLDLGRDVVLECLGEVGLAFFFAPQWHPAVRHVMPVRQQLGFRTIFNLLGPLCNPVRAPFQLVGVARIEWADRIAGALRHLETQRAVVVVGSDGLDEVTLEGPTHVLLVAGGNLVAETWTPNSFGLPPGRRAEWQVESVEASAALIRRILHGETGSPRDIVLANAAAALFAAGQVTDLPAGVAAAAQAIDSGKALAVLERLVRFTNQAGVGQEERSA